MSCSSHEEPGTPEITDNHRRAVSTTLGLLDAMLHDFERWAGDEEVRSALYHRTNRLRPGHVRRIRREIAEMRRIMSHLRVGLHLEPKREEAATMIWSRASTFQETLLRIESRSLRAYGKIPEGLPAYMDPQVRRLSECLRRLAEATHATASDEGA